jgi:D-alanyl-D-alanine carboxypeptidase (penicillin-binding protein 5/6)
MTRARRAAASLIGVMRRTQRAVATLIGVMTRTQCVAVFFIGVALVATQAVAAPTPGATDAALPDPYAGSAHAYLVQTDDVDRFGAQIDTPLPAASLGKMMTALLVAEARPDAGAVTTISPTAAAAGGARLGLRAGERIDVESLLAAMLLRSANDSCAALAEWQAGSERAFVARMNARAVALGLAGTHFVNACGFDAPGQHSTARDLLVLARRVLAQPALAALVRRESMTIATQGGRRFALRNTNALLGRVPGVIGVKTGYTSKAGTCLVVVAERKGRRVYVALLGAGDRWWDAAAMIERAFDADTHADADVHTGVEARTDVDVRTGVDDHAHADPQTGVDVHTDANARAR